MYCFASEAQYCMMHLLVGGFRPRYTSVEHENLDNSVFEDAGIGVIHPTVAPRAMFDEDQEQNEPPPMHRSKSSLGAQSRGIFAFIIFYLSFALLCTLQDFL